MRASLIPLDGGQPIEIVKDVTVVGRKEFCDLRLQHPSVSKVHLVIVQTDGLLLFRDLGSTNGTKVNGQRVIRGALLPNDKLSVAACKFRVQMAPDAHTEQTSESEASSDPESSDVRVIHAKDIIHEAAPQKPAEQSDDPHAMLLDTDRPPSTHPNGPETPDRASVLPVLDGDPKDAPPQFAE